MSASTVRRIKERGGGGSKVTASTEGKLTKSLTPVSAKAAGNDPFKISTGKENPRAISRGRASVASVSQKPVIRPMPRIDKPDSSSRLSTSSVPRGRSSSPFESNRLLSDIRKSRSSRVSEVRTEKVSVPQIERSVSSGGKTMNGIRGNLDRLQPKKPDLNELRAKSCERSRIRVSKERGFQASAEVSEVSQKAEILVKILDETKSNTGSSSVSSKECSNGTVSEELKGTSRTIPKSTGNDKGSNRVHVGIKELERRAPTGSGSRGTAIMKSRTSVDEGTAALGVNKYPSKLHEKLAFLEGKVKRIASDIKKTKDMLDMNNPDSSKVILTDIQEKIAGIEKAMEHVNGAEGKIGATVETDDVGHSKSESKEANRVLPSVKGLNTEELEARLFPHHKLIKDRTSVKVPLESSTIHQLSLVEPSVELKPEENLIAVEFLESLSKDQQKVTKRVEYAVPDFIEVQETDGAVISTQDSVDTINVKGGMEVTLTTNETLDEFDDQENLPKAIVEEDMEDSDNNQLRDIGSKVSTGGWFVSEGESVLLAHHDGSCSFYDIANCEEKSEYKPPPGISPNIWRDCWIVRAPGADGCSGRYVVAASAGNTLDSGFCSWDFYTKDVRAFHIDDATIASRTALAPISNNTSYRRNSLSTIMAPENQQWWYKPCGPLVVSTATCQRAVRVYDVRDGEEVMKWEVQKPVLEMDYSSPLQWRNRGKVVIAEAETITVWDVNSPNAQALLSVSSSGRRVSALHVNNTDAELGGGVRQRVSSSEAEGNDGVFCTAEAINVLDFRHRSGIGLKIPKLGSSAQSVSSRGDSIFVGGTSTRSAGRKQPSSQVQQFSLRKQRLFNTYSLPESKAHSHYTAITQVWGNSSFVMGACSLGLFVFDAFKDDGLQSFAEEKFREIIGPDDLYSPSFDYLSSRVLLISRDRPAQWRYLS